MSSFHEQVEQICRDAGMEFDRLGFTLGPRGANSSPQEIASEILKAHFAIMREQQRPMEDRLREALFDAYIALSKINRLAYTEMRDWGKIPRELSLRMSKISGIADWGALSAGNFFNRDESRDARAKVHEDIEEWKNEIEQIL